MQNAISALRGGRFPARAFTTMLCCVWGYSFAYSLFRCLLYRPNVCVGLAATLPLAVVWGTLERKRWGRIALLCLSFLALSLFVWMLGTLFFAGRSLIAPAERNLSGYLSYAVNLFAETPLITIATLILSGITALWFLLPAGRSEFNQGKKVVLTSGQRLIAGLIVILWCLGMMLTPAAVEKKSQPTPIKASRRLTTRY